MNRRLLVVTGALLCAIIGTATAFTVRNRAAGKAARNSAIARASAPQKSATHTTALSSAGPNAQDGMAGITPPTLEVPDYVVYGHLFHFNNVMLHKAQEIEALGQDGSGLRNALKNAAQLDDTQVLTFNQIAASCDQQVAVFDSQARVIVAALRAQYANGQQLPGDEPPQPSQELMDLQQQRNDAILAARDQLQQAFGEAAFTNFQSYVQQSVVPQITRQPLDSLRPAGSGRPMRPATSASSVRPPMPEGEQRQPGGIPNKIKQ
jgi:hypothetical protein